MIAESGNGEPTSRRYKRRYGPLRLAMPWLSVAVGISMVIKGTLDLGSGDNGSPLFVVMGSSLIVLGVVAFFVYRWMAKRGV